MTSIRLVLRTILCVLTETARALRSHLDAATGGLAARLRVAWHDESGGVAEKVVIVAIFVALAIAAGAIITTKVIDKANSINLG